MVRSQSQSGSPQGLLGPPWWLGCQTGWVQPEEQFSEAASTHKYVGSLWLPPRLSVEQLRGPMASGMETDINTVTMRRPVPQGKSLIPNQPEESMSHIFPALTTVSVLTESGMPPASVCFLCLLCCHVVAGHGSPGIPASGSLPAKQHTTTPHAPVNHTRAITRA